MSIHPSFSQVTMRLSILASILVIAGLVVACVPTDTVKNHASAGVETQIDLTNQDSTYIGEKACLECHKNAGDHASMGVHVSAFRSNPQNARQREVCESCHGPGSKHAQETTNRSLIIGYTKGWGTPVPKQNAVCLTCHQGGQRINWARSPHDVNEVACSDCHNPMMQNSATGNLLRVSINETCYTCHPQQRAEFLKRSHMPLPEGKMSCNDCHNPHGSPTRPLLKTDTVNETCYECHAEKRGPFLWEHAPVRENCVNCHQAHGSNHDKLLVAPRPMLCQQCHDAGVGHPGNFYNNSQTAESALQVGGVQSQRVIGRACQNCHTQIHGSNHPSGARFQR
ncbi:DmsE family decaheme c-type cytochrome [Thiobaca trueperi]|uniref:DmsE family decaheme c-type cytochrome n=1 Tax=Thiobaca trueperi TaxID=127458 RepID=A0A4V2V1Q2_9GAMM|nr:DmsE family decaheme c-type cytochrome [Thiobaca trueperi]TCT22012.1 DmsE family decaheme c-type cytochrome [Thiobaca trueperi]